MKKIEVIDKIKKILDAFNTEISSVSNETDLNKIENAYVKNSINKIFSDIRDIESNIDKKSIGTEINTVKILINQKIEDARNILNSDKQLRNHLKHIDNKVINKRGILHVLNEFVNLIVTFFCSLGFSIVDGNDIEDSKNNFDKLNIPEYHPARDMQDTFYIDFPSRLLRSHTSTSQIKTMEIINPPFKIISFGNTYRVDDIDATHTPMFYQLEGLLVEKNLSLSNLKWLLHEFISDVFGNSNIKSRFRPSYYPYVEPGMATDMECIFCNESNRNVCRACKGSKWITILGSGLVHPNVFKNVGYNFSKESEYSGLAFGLGINRLAMLYYGVPEARILYENNIRLAKTL